MSEKFKFKKEDIPCEHQKEESQSHPYGMRSATETWWECTSEDEFPEDYEVDSLKCDPSCLFYKPVEVKTCKKHGEYIDACSGCEFDQYEKDRRLAEDYWRSRDAKEDGHD